LVGGGIILLIALIVIGIAALHAYSETERAPRIPMFVCDKHGPMPKSSTLKLFDVPMDHLDDNGKMVRKEILYCSICYEERIVDARKHVK
jgi:hypothetical protein